MKTYRGIFFALTFCTGLLGASPLFAQIAPPPSPPLPPGLPQPREILIPPGIPNLLPPIPAVAAQPALRPPVIGQPVIGQPVISPVVALPPANPNALVWDAENKEITPSPGEASGSFTFWFTNVSSTEVIINSVRTSCGCTTAKLPSMPWHVAAGTNGSLDVAIDLRGKSGVISKAVTVDSTAGIKSLIVKINMPGALPVAGHTVPAMNDVDRLKNMQSALADRQVVFKDAACAKCHAEPAKGLVAGHQLYSAVCGTCHDSPQRAALVTDLRTLKHETDADYWKQWITYGRAGSMMPAFGDSQGGPLNDHQIDMLAAYCASTFRPVTTVATATNSAVSVFPLPAKTN